MIYKQLGNWNTFSVEKRAYTHINQKTRNLRNEIETIKNEYFKTEEYNI